MLLINIEEEFYNPSADSLSSIALNTYMFKGSPSFFFPFSLAFSPLSVQGLVEEIWGKIQDKGVAVVVNTHAYSESSLFFSAILFPYTMDVRRHQDAESPDSLLEDLCIALAHEYQISQFYGACRDSLMMYDTRNGGVVETMLGTQRSTSGWEVWESLYFETYGKYIEVNLEDVRTVSWGVPMSVKDRAHLFSMGLLYDGNL